MKNKLDSDISPEKKQLRDTLGPDFDGEILGYGVMYTVGADYNCLVPRDWLLERVEDLGLPEWIMPKQPGPHYAFDRAIQRMKQSWLKDYYIESPRADTGVIDNHRVRVELLDGDGKRIFHVRAEVFFDEEEVREEGGKWVPHTLGTFRYNSDTQRFVPKKNESLDEDEYLYSVWEDVSAAGIALHRQMMHTHIARDIRHMMYLTIRDHTNTVIKLRRSVYLFPAALADFVDNMSQLYSEINDEFKTVGEPVAIRTFEVLNKEDNIDWIQHQVESTLESNLDSILEGAFEKFDEGEAASSIVEKIEKSLTTDSDTVEMYNALLETEMDIEEVLTRQKLNLNEDDKKEILDSVIEQIKMDQQ